MKTIKLQVGKTYRSREGEEVGIVKKDSGGSSQFKGSDGDWYTEGGKWGRYSEASLDLIEEVTVSDANQKHNEMEVLALEVGKTYVNRKGEEVRITDFAEGVPYPYKGNKGVWYRADGRWVNAESPQDLIEEVTRHTFAIPEGVKEVTVSKEGNRIVVEMVPEKAPKPGDVMVNERGSVYIFKSDRYNGGYHKCFAWFGASGNLLIGDWCLPGRIATPEEAQPLFDALKKEGKKWNPETMQVEDVPEKVVYKEGDVVFEDGRIMIVKMHPNLYHAMINTNNGNLHINCSYGIPFTSAHFRLATPEEAQPLWDALKKAGKKWNAGTMQVEEIAEIDRIREWVERHLEDGHYNQEGIAEVIGHYLKHKEGEK